MTCGVVAISIRMDSRFIRSDLAPGSTFCVSSVNDEFARLNKINRIGRAVLDGTLPRYGVVKLGLTPLRLRTMYGTTGTQ